MKTCIKEKISKIESWLDKKGFVLCKSNKKTIEDEVDFERRVVFLSQRSKPEHQLYSLLHECGHVVIRKRKDYKTRFKESLYIAEECKMPTIRSSIEEIEEEILAWREGEYLAKKLSIDLDSDLYYKYGTKWVMTYVVLAANGREYLLFPSKKDEQDNAENVSLTKILDNVHETCYGKIIDKTTT